MTTYPQVINESDTLDLILSGQSLARYGDGEFKMAAHEAGIKSQCANPALSARLREILIDSGACLVGIPNILDVQAHPLASLQKQEFWGKHTKFAALLTKSRRYASAFISRPDSAPWINTAEYWAKLETLWVGRDITVVGGSGKSLQPDDLRGARQIRHVVCRRQHAWQDYDEILDRIGTPERALICLGPTATVLAVELCARGVQAIDLGHTAIFMRKWRRGESMVVTDDDKSVDRQAVA